VIYEELCRGQVLDASRARFVEISDRLAAAGAEGLLLACTEIELLVGPGDTALHQFPTTSIHVDAILDAALA
jgi:aspartate racemase